MRGRGRLGRDRAATVGVVEFLRGPRRPAARRAPVPAGRRLGRERVGRPHRSLLADALQRRPGDRRHRTWCSTASRIAWSASCRADSAGPRTTASGRSSASAPTRSCAPPTSCRGSGGSPPARPWPARAPRSTAVAAELARTVPENRGRGVEVLPVRDAIVGSDLRMTSMLFLGVVGFVLLICCANVANLLLARATARGARAGHPVGARRRPRPRRAAAAHREPGAGRRSAASWAPASARPSWRQRPRSSRPGCCRRRSRVAFDARVVTFCAAAALLVGVLFGIAPAWQAGDLTSARAIAADSRTSTGGGGRLRSVLVVGRGGHGGAAAGRRRSAAAHAAGGAERRSRLSRRPDPDDGGRSARVALSHQRIAAAVLRRGGARGGGGARRRRRRLGEHAAARPVRTPASAPSSIVGDAPPDDSQRPLADYQIVSASYFDTIDLPVVVRPGVRADRPAAKPVGLHRERGVRARGTSAAATRSASAWR